MVFTVPLILQVAAATAAAALPPVPPLQPNPLEGTVAALRSFAAAAPPLVADSGLRRADYLVTIAGVVDFFTPLQAPGGAILDPATGIEEEYSTPCYAWAAALLVTAAGRSDLLAPAALALDWSIASMANGSAACAQATCDFYSVPVMRALGALSTLVAPARAAAWEAALRSLTNKTFELPGQNWELTAAAGEYDRMVLRGWGTAAFNWSYWEARIGRLATVGPGGAGFWGPTGVFNDNLGQPVVSPCAYDAFGSSYVAVLLASGYAATGAYAAYLAPTMQRGVWTHAAFQSPLGEQPVGGRSNQHQFIEATLAAVAEVYAGAAAAAGDGAGACQLQRAARLYHASVRAWRRPDSALQITKNRFANYTTRFGFMGYSFFSNYNLLPAAWLALAYSYADARDAIPECPAPADVGGAAFALTDVNTRKVFAAVAGTYVEVATGADPSFDATGLARFHFSRCAANATAPCALPVALGPSAAPGIDGNTAVEGVGGGAGPAPPAAAAATGPWWRLAGESELHTLANHTLQSVTAAVMAPSPGNSPASGVAFSLQYVLWGEGVLVTEAYSLPAAGGVVSVTASVSAPGARALARVMMEAAAAAATATPLSSSSRYYFPPADAAVAAAVAAGDFEALLAAAPAPSSPPAFEAFGVVLPAFAFDGAANFSATLNASANRLIVAPAASTAVPAPAGVPEGVLQFTVVSPAQPLQWNVTSIPLLSRNGILHPVYAGYACAAGEAAPSISYELAVVLLP